MVTGVGNDSAKAVLIRHPGSHQFEDRTLILDKPLRIGRSVGHVQPTSNNGIFDCKVLSRNHALIWFENGRFLLRDTNSSNGTFVNSQRLDKLKKESSREVFSGDTVQFGVSVIENTRKVIHGCIIATLKLFLSDGREAKPGCTPTMKNSRGKIGLDDLYQLNQYLQESLYREQVLESKLTSLQNILQTLRNATELGWRAVKSNNNLLSRVEFLELQLKCYSNQFPNDKLHKELQTLQEDKNMYEKSVKKFIQRILNEKMETIQRCHNLNRVLEDLKTECVTMQGILASYISDLRSVAATNEVLKKNNEILESNLASAEEKSRDIIDKLTDENIFLMKRAAKMNTDGQLSREKIKNLIIEKECAEEKASFLKNQLKILQQFHIDLLSKLAYPSIIKNTASNTELFALCKSIYSICCKKCHTKTLILKVQMEELTSEKKARELKVIMLQSEIEKLSGHLETYLEEQADIQMKISIKEFNSVPDILDEMNGKKSMENDLLELHEKRKLLGIVQRDIGLTNNILNELQIVLRSVNDEISQISASYSAAKKKLRFIENQLISIESAVLFLDDLIVNLSQRFIDITSEEKLPISDDSLSNENRTVQEQVKKFLHYFTNFISIVYKEFDAIENRELIIFNGDSLYTDLTQLKSESNDLVLILNELYANFNSLKLHVNNEKPKNLNIQIAKPPQIIKNMQVTDLIILNEKYLSIREEKLSIDDQFAKLKQQYNSIPSYPHLDLHLLVPILLIVLAFILKFDYRFLFSTNE